MRPRIGITSGTASAEWGPEGRLWRAYATAVEAAGGEAVHLDAATRGRAAEVVDSLAGLLFSGGRDIDPAFWPNPPETGGEPREALVSRYRLELEPERDVWELPLVLEALARGRPLLGICRGCQLLHVALGGRLVLDIETEIGAGARHRAGPPPEARSARHALQIEPGTRLATVLPPAQFPECNSRHHQAVRPEPGMRARVAARSPEDGVVEAIEVPDHPWAIGVQWHPEHPGDADLRAQFRPLFAAFVEACRQAAAREKRGEGCESRTGQPASRNP